MSDTKKFRQAFKDAGFRNARPWLPLKLWDGNHIFAAPPFAQQELERQLKKQFQGRYLYGMFIAATSRMGGKSFIVKLVA
jgi:uncharacterized protein (DUF1697 family)